MNTRALVLIAILPMAARGQLVLTASDGGSTSILPANSVYQLSQMEVGEARTLTIRVTNSGTSNITVTQFSADGAGFVMQAPNVPFILAPNRFVEGSLRFSANAAASYSANLQVNQISVLLLASVAAGAVLGVSPNCGGSSSPTLNFGTVTRGEPRTCNVTLQNPSSQALNISTLTVTGPGFSLSGSPAVPFTLGPSQVASFSISLNARAPGTITGTLRVQSRDYSLAATAINGPLPQPILEFESSAPASGQQRRITMRLPAAAPYSATGFLNLAFQSAVASVTDDPAVMFLPSGSRQIPFTVEAGQTAVALSGQAFTTFQTGATAGQLRFTLTGIPAGFTSDPTVTMTIAPTPIAIDAVSVTRVTDHMTVVVAGFDNTFSAGAMTFSFFDGAGKLYGAAIPADFTAAFQTFFTSSGASVFRTVITFPASGDLSAITGFEAELRNSAGTVRTQRVSF
ncbi:MAG: choice-of-anchor D domain-containing protein [Acidobacteriota bacterium]